MNSKHYYGFAGKVIEKERKYRDLVSEKKYPFLICLSVAGKTLLSEFDTYDFFIGHNKRGLFYTDENFRHNVTGIMLKGAFGKYSFNYFHNENANNQLTVENLQLLKQSA